MGPRKVWKNLGNRQKEVGVSQVLVVDRRGKKDSKIQGLANKGSHSRLVSAEGVVDGGLPIV